MTDLFIAVLFLLLVYIAYRVHDINIRIQILDLRHRVMERLMGWPYEKKYSEAYDDVFGNLYTGDYDKLLRFSRKNDLHLPVRTMEEEKARIARLSKTENGLEQLAREKESEFSTSFGHKDQTRN